MSSTFSLKRGFAEGTVIVLSVFLALAADAWWDGRQASVLESQVLQEVSQEVAANRTSFQSQVEFIKTQLERTDRFLGQPSFQLGSLPNDSVALILNALGRSTTYDPRMTAASLLSQTALLSADGIGIRALVSDFVAQVADADEEKETFRGASVRVQDHLANHARATDSGGVTLIQMTALLGPSGLEQLRSDQEFVRLVMRRSNAGHIYVRVLEGTVGPLLDSLSAQLPAH